MKNRIMVSAFLGLIGGLLINVWLGYVMWLIIAILIALIFIFVVNDIQIGIKTDCEFVRKIVFGTFKMVITFITVLGLGMGIFIFRIYHIVNDFESKRAEIELALSDQLIDEVKSVKISRNEELMDVAPCWESRVVVYKLKKDYEVIIPLTYPPIMSFSSFPVLHWVRDNGWVMDRISVYLSFSGK